MKANKPNAPNAAITPQQQFGRINRGIGDSDR
jgi:hypothetical protein